VQVVGEANSLTPDTLRRLRRSPDAQKRRTPVVVWVAGTEEAERWRNAGALTVSGALSASNASKALDRCRDVPWVESAGYIGPDRRHKRTWLNRSVRRLDDEAVSAQPDKAQIDNSSFETRLRQLRFAAFKLDTSDRARRAQFLADVKSAVRAAERARRMHSAAAMESLARYLAARGATGALDQAIIDKHLDVSDFAAAEAGAWMPRLQKAVDRAIGVAQPA
jgi:hypothetical protein